MVRFLLHKLKLATQHSCMQAVMMLFNVCVCLCIIVTCYNGHFPLDAVMFAGWRGGCHKEINTDQTKAAAGITSFPQTDAAHVDRSLIVVITLPAVCAEQRGPSDGSALLNFHRERPESVSLSFHIVICVGGGDLTMSYLGAVQGETGGRLMMVILSRIARGNVNDHFHHGCNVRRCCRCSSDINIPKKERKKEEEAFSQALFSY